jgi:DNA-binding LacI/PurR family transcriptional regulator
MPSTEPSRMRPRRVTSADVAKTAGVSRATVSYVLNQTSGQSISDATADRVRAAAQALDYAPSASARALRSGHSNVVLALLMDWDLGPTYPQVFARLSATLTEHGYVLLMHSIDDQAASIRDLLNFVSPTLVFTLQPLPARQIAVLGSAGIRSVSVDLWSLLSESGWRQAEYLISQGHQRIGYLLPDHFVPDQLTEPRIEGIRRACAEHGLTPPRVLRMAYSDEGIASLASEWLDDSAGVTGIAAHTDEVAAFVMSKIGAEVLRTRGVGLVGMSNRPIANIGLTTVAVNIDAWALLFAEGALAALEDRPAVRIDGDTTYIVVRESA